VRREGLVQLTDPVTSSGIETEKSPKPLELRSGRTHRCELIKYFGVIIQSVPLAVPKVMFSLSLGRVGEMSVPLCSAMNTHGGVYLELATRWNCVVSFATR
jgi:hypothetical protein